MKNPSARWWSFLLQLALYGLLVSIYLWLVIHFLNGWLRTLFADQRGLYAFVSLFLMIIQSVVLERLTSVIVAVTRRRNR
jgi:hypothetical protein